MTFPNPSKPRVFGLPGGWFGTSMAAPAVSAAAAMVIASGVLGTQADPDEILTGSRQPRFRSETRPEHALRVRAAGHRRRHVADRPHDHNDPHHPGVTATAPVPTTTTAAMPTATTRSARHSR